MRLVLIVALPLLGGMLAWPVRDRRSAWARWTSLAALGLDLVLAFSLWPRSGWGGAPVAEVSWEWIPRFGISFRLGLDGLSFVLVVLTLVLGLVAVLASWQEVSHRVGFFHFNLLWTIAGILGVFLARDLLLFYFFWELMLVPMYFLIGIWGHERRVHAALKFFLFTQASGLLMLLAILGTVRGYYQQTGSYSFAYADLLSAAGGGAGLWLFLGFFVAFAVKLPALPLHTWLPDAHTEAPTAGSVILAGLLLKTGAYGLLRFAIPLFPDVARELRPLGMLLGVVGILYGALLAFAQSDLKRMVAYSSISHLGFVLLGVFAGNPVALEGVVIQMISHGFSTGALFVLVGLLQERCGTRELSAMGGLAAVAPRMASMGTFFAMASLGLPGLGNFVGELLVLVGSFGASPMLTSLAALGLVLATVYSLFMLQSVFHGAPGGEERPLWNDLGRREGLLLLALAGLLLWLGLFPQRVLDAAGPALEGLQPAVAHDVASAE